MGHDQHQHLPCGGYEFDTCILESQQNIIDVFEKAEIWRYSKISYRNQPRKVSNTESGSKPESCRMQIIIYLLPLGNEDFFRKI